MCIDLLRRKKRRQETSLTENYDDRDEGAELSIPDANPLPEQQAITNETKIELARAMGQLAPDHREILQLRVVEDLPYEQIADILGVRVGTVKSRMARARLSLRKILTAGNYFASASSEPVEAEVRLCTTARQRWRC